MACASASVGGGAAARGQANVKGAHEGQGHTHGRGGQRQRGGPQRPIAAGRTWRSGGIGFAVGALVGEQRFVLPSLGLERALQLGVGRTAVCIHSRRRNDLGRGRTVRLRGHAASGMTCRLEPTAHLVELGFDSLILGCKLLSARQVGLGACGPEARPIPTSAPRTRPDPRSMDTWYARCNPSAR